MAVDQYQFGFLLFILLGGFFGNGHQREFRSSLCCGKFNWVMRRKFVWLSVVLGMVFYARAYCKQADLTYAFKPEVIARSMADFAAIKRNFSLTIGVPDFAAEKYVERDTTHKGYGILYIHGFGATRAEGEGVVDDLAASLNANVYYLRLPGHGLTAGPHAAATFDQYLNAAEEALLHCQLMGKKIIVMGTSTGALLATYLGMNNPKRIHALVLASPLWDFGNKATRLLNFPGGLALAELVMGKDRDANWKSDPEKRVHRDYHKYWLTQQKTAALVNLNNLRRFVVDGNKIAGISVPALAIYYFKDEAHQDNLIDISVVRAWLQVPGISEKNRLLEISDGSHVLLSDWVRSDKSQIKTETLKWLRSL
jgi:pimeloyl-ACP methyl ester carboxylesterase